VRWTVRGDGREGTSGFPVHLAHDLPHALARTPGSWGQWGADGGRRAGGAAGGRLGAGRRVTLARMASCRVWAKANRRGPFWTAAVVFKKERVKGFEPPFEAGTSTLARGGASVRSGGTGGGCASRGLALHRALHGLAAVGGKCCQSFVGSDDAGELICGANSVELVRPRELALPDQRCADGGRTGLFTSSSECGCPNWAANGYRRPSKGFT
jgi:hypothetical protein